MLWQFRQTGVSYLQMWKRCWFKAMWPLHNWNSMNDCLWLSPEIRWMYFLNGAEFSMDFSSFYLRDVFQSRSHCFLILLLWLWWSTEMLSSKSFLRNLGRNLASPELPWAAFFASSSAFLLGAKLTCPSTQWICKSTIPFGLPFQLLPSAIAPSHSATLIKLSCFLWRASANWRILLKIYCPGWEHWLSRALMTAWLSKPKAVEWVSLLSNLIRRCRLIARPTPLAS